MLSRRLLFSFILAISLVCPLSHGAKNTTLPLNQIQPNGLAEGWTDNSQWAEVDVEFRADQVFEELKVQQVVQTKITAGRAQMMGPALTFRKGLVYTVSVRMRSNSGEVPIMVMVRERGAPYQDYVVNRTLTAQPEWTTQSFYFKAEKTVSNYPFILGFPQACDLSIERIDVLEETEAEFDKRMEKVLGKNPVFLHPNPVFKLGTFGYDTYASIDRKTQYPHRTADQYSLDPPSFTVEQFETGAAIGCLEVGDYSSTLLSTFVDLVPGREVKLITRVRRTEGQGYVRLRAFSPAWVSAPQRQVQVGEDWVNLEIAGMPPLQDQLQVRAELTAFGGADGAGTLEVQYLLISQDAESALAQINDFGTASFGVESDRMLSFYEVGEHPSVQLRHVAGSGQFVNWKLVDTYGQVQRSGVWELSKEAGLGQSYSFKDLPVGWWQLQWSAPWALGKAGVLNIAVVPSVERIAGKSSPFGIHVEGSAYGLRKMEYMGIQWLRTNNPLWTKWTAVQPEKDVWVYPDEEIDRFVDAGKSVIFNLDRTPLWAARIPGELGTGTDYMDFKADLPGDWDAWREYVRRMVTRYKDKIDAWEVWNEPDIPFLRPPEGMTNADAYLQLLENSSPIIRELDPEAQIIASPAYYLKKRSNPEGYQEDFTERLIEAGGMQYLDVYSIHYYLTAGQRIFDRPEVFKEKLQTVLDAMREAGQPNPEIWNSEWGIINFTVPTHPIHLPSTNGITPDQAARELVVWSVGMLSAGVEKLFWYDGQDNFFYHFHVTKNLFDYSQPRPAAVAFAVLTKQLDGLTFTEEEQVQGEAGRVLHFSDERKSRNLCVAYAHFGKSFKFEAKEGDEAVDYMGQPVHAVDGDFEIGEDPIYILR